MTDTTPPPEQIERVNRRAREIVGLTDTPAAPMTPHRIVDGYCFDCNGGCLVGFGNPQERCPVDGCDELPEDHYHPACNDPRHDEIESWYRQVLAARSTLAEPLDMERLAATEWAYDTMPESFDVIRDPVEAWNDRFYPATSHDKGRYRRRAAAILARLSRNEEADR